MNRMKHGMIGTITLLLASTSHTFAVVGQALQVQGTNLVLSWPSQGYEIYYVQSRSTLNSTDSWSSLTNDYPANSTNRTTLLLPHGTNKTGFFQVYHIPNFLADFSGYTFDGPTFIPVDYADYLDRVDDTTVLINGEPTDDAVFTSDYYNGQTNWGVGIYFDRLPNGTNTIQLVSTLRLSDTLNDSTAYLVLSNATQGINIGNFVTYTNWDDLILSNAYTFKAQSSVTNVDWEIDIYDVYGYFVNSQTGHSADGNISWTWDLTDYTGASRLDDGDPFFYPYITIGDPSSGYMPSIANQYPDEGAWLFAYMDKFYDDGTTNYAGADSYYTNGINDLEGGPGIWGTITYDAPIKYGSNYSQTDRNNSWDSLRSDLQSWNARNFYYFGHGAPSSIGGDISILDSSNNITGSKNFPGSNAKLTAQWVQSNVTANKSYGAMPFRFVFLDGCDTAAGNWPQAWGVPKQAEPQSYYTSSANTSHARPSAFVGWDVEIGGSKDWGTAQTFWAFRADWMGAWANEFQRQLNDAFTEAFTDSNWVTPDHYSHLKEYGYTTMMFQEYNHAGNWP